MCAVRPVDARLSAQTTPLSRVVRPTLGAMSQWRRRLLVVDDEALVRTLLSESLTQAGFTVATASDAAQARKEVAEFDPDVAVIDIHLGSGPSGLHLGHALHRSRPEIGLVFLTKYHDRHVGGLDAWDVPPGSAFLAKDLLGDTHALVEAIDSVLRGGIIPDERSDGPLSELTRKQLEILHLVALGFTNSAIARIRNTQGRTVEQRLKAIYKSLNISTTGDLNPRVEAVRRYISTVGLPQGDRDSLVN